MIQYYDQLFRYNTFPHLISVLGIVSSAGAYP